MSESSKDEVVLPRVRRFGLYETEHGHDLDHKTVVLAPDYDTAIARAESAEAERDRMKQQGCSDESLIQITRIIIERDDAKSALAELRGKIAGLGKLPPAPAFYVVGGYRDDKEYVKTAAVYISALKSQLLAVKEASSPSPSPTDSQTRR